MRKPIASQLPMHQEKLNRMLSINYLNLMSIHRAPTYVSPYFATEIHRSKRAVLDAATATDTKTQMRDQRTSLARLCSLIVFSSNPPQGCRGLIYCREINLSTGIWGAA